MTVGALAGAIVGVVLGLMNEAPEGFSNTQLIGFFVLLLVVVGIGVGAAIALIVDKALAKSATTGTATRHDAS